MVFRITAEGIGAVKRKPNAPSSGLLNYNLQNPSHKILAAIIRNAFHAFRRSTMFGALRTRSVFWVRFCCTLQNFCEVRLEARRGQISPWQRNIASRSTNCHVASGLGQWVDSNLIMTHLQSFGGGVLEVWWNSGSVHEVPPANTFDWVFDESWKPELTKLGIRPLFLSAELNS